MEDDAESISSVQGHNGDAEELADDGWVNLELCTLDGELVHTIRVVSDASVGNFKSEPQSCGHHFNTLLRNQDRDIHYERRLHEVHAD